MLKTRIPPPVVMLAFVLLLYISSFMVGKFTFAGQSFIAFLLFITGLGCLFAAVIEFKKAKTTVNPLDPGSATYLVVNGVFKHTRNPMYLGFFIIIAAAGVYLGVWTLLLLLPLFIPALNYLQIIPEEIAMQKIFGEEYISYCNSVRRWI